ncbi:hypothetical protein [Kibdelosporangium aridum]|uniref:hypothetical protein n=1 Tax=Kibdelosporangium aridum TaxID=2030 RepID=UPI000F77225B|nr:hypothetical protein [Kibdelosporangium aridum]
MPSKKDPNSGHIVGGVHGHGLGASRMSTVEFDGPAAAVEPLTVEELQDSWCVRWAPGSADRPERRINGRFRFAR